MALTSNNKFKYLFIWVMALGVLLVVATSLYVGIRLDGYNHDLQNKIGETEAELLVLAKTLTVNGANEEVATFVKDCSLEHRTKFDNLLDTLNQKSSVESEELLYLFDACASFFADKRFAVLSQVEIKYSELKTLTNLYSVFDENANEMVMTDDWDLFIDLQSQIADLSQEQVIIQLAIIKALREGKSSSDLTVRDEIKKAQSITQSASILTKQSDSVLKKLTNS